MFLNSTGLITRYVSLIAVTLLILVSHSGFGQIYSHNFGTTAITAHPYTVAPAIFDSHLSNSSWTNSVGAWTSTTGSTGQAIRLTSGVPSTITLTFNVATNYQVTVNSFSFWHQRSAAGALNWSMAINGIAVGNGAVPTTGGSTGVLNVTNPVSGLTGTVTVVLSLTSVSANSTYRLDDFTLNGSVTPSCTAPVIGSFTPLSGPQNTLVTINGSGFSGTSGASAVKFNGINASSYTVVSDTQIKAYTPAGNTTGPIVVTTSGCQGTSTTNFTAILSAGANTYSSDIYISEIYDVGPAPAGAGGDAGIIEIYNGTANAVNLSGYTINRYGDAGDYSSFYTITLTGIIPAGGVFLIGVGGSALPCVSSDNLHYPTGFNGNDEFQLFNNGVLIDDVVAPTSPGYSIIRNSNAIAPKPVFVSSDWQILSAESCTDIGVHAVSTAVLPTVTTQPVSKTACENTSVTFSVALSNPAGYTYQWKYVAQNSGTWVNVTNTGGYSGANTNTLTINPLPLSFNNNQYYCQATSVSGTVVSNAAQLVVNSGNVIPVFNAVAPICSGDTLAPLPTTSNNGITGTWSPALNNTANTTYTFTPNAGQCATTTTLTINVNSPVTPTFNPVAPICSGDALAPLPTTSNNGITGTWSPALNNTANTTYTFTPNAGQCATTTTLTINVNTPLTPTFTVVAPICSGDALAPLPTTSNNGITGTWSPALNNTANTTYTFTPNAGQCATTATLTINVNTPVTPTFNPVAPICSGDALAPLPTTSNNGIAGTWSPALNNTANTTYTFTPNAGQCATTTTLTINVNSPVTPTFNTIAPICSGDALAPLPTTSTNGITGTWSPALNNTANTTYTFTPNAGQCATTTTLTINVNTTPVTPTFNPVAPICSGDALAPLPTTSNNGIAGTWSPALDNTANTTYTFTPNAGQCATTTTLTINVNSPVTPTFNPVAPICSGDTLAPLPTTSNNGITGTWSPALNNTANTTYTFTPNAGQCATTATLTINVNTPVTPTFNPVAPICSGDALAPLPTTSNNGIAGTWSPALDNTANTTYTFTPNAGQCATTTTLTINVNTTPVTPTFNPVAPICSGDALAPLPTTSNNGITGTWSPALNNTANTTYTFTPNAGQCATTTTLTINVNSPVTPTFTAVAPICSGDALAPLPTTSNNGITGTWSPALNNTANTTYTFTPNAGQCATTATLTINVNSPVTPTFNPVAPICSGDALAPLPTTSNNGITGTWSPALNNTANTTYTFTPNAGQCATTTTLTINVNTPVTPTFNPVAPICSGDALAPLPTTSNNGIAGTWSPAFNNTANTTYTFTPNAGQCATTATLTINVNTPVTPTFNPLAPICSGDALAPLPTTSNNGITGTWSPALNNTANTTYTFTPNAGQCATTATLTINVNTPVTPTFNPVAPICSGDALAPLPTTSNNGITGTWSPALNNTANTTYTFTPNAGQCATTATLTINVNTPVTPTFNPVAPICSGDALAPLPTTSNNGIAGTWSPALNNTANTTYTFTPNAGQCATTTTLTINVNSPVTPTFNTIAPICSGDALAPLPTTSTNGITGTWSPALNNTANTTYTFTPNAGQCATTTTLTINVNSATPVAAISGPANICENDTAVFTDATAGGTWSSSNTAVATIDSNGTVTGLSMGTVTITYAINGSCPSSATQTLNVNPVPVPVLKNKYLCVDNTSGAIISSVVLISGVPSTNHSFLWTLDNNPYPATTPSITTQQPGTYKVIATDLTTGCSGEATAVVGTSSIAIADATVGQDFDNSQTITITVTGGSGDYEFELDGGMKQDSNVFTHIYQGEYNIVVRDKNGCGELELTVFALNYPHFFTPNGDGYNDFWNIRGLSDQPKATIYIFDRYGKLLTSVSPASNDGWDGRYNGQDLPATDYWFTLKYISRAGMEKEFKSHFSLKR